MTNSIRTLIVDDEALARKKIRALLDCEPDIDIVGECASGTAAVSTVREMLPDLMFLDVQMPGLDGFSTLAEIERKHLPRVVFVTAYDKYALRAFEVHALDYVLKPFDRERMAQVLARVRSDMLRTDKDINRLLSVLKELKSTAPEQKRLLVKQSGNILFLRHDEIDWVEAADNYVRLHVGSNSYFLRQSMSSLETSLDQRFFARIHRSTIVNVERIKKLQPLFHGDYEVVLKTGVRLTLSRTYRVRFEQVLGQQL